MNMVTIKTADLIGKPLDYAVAQVEGWQWARNASRRSGDSFAHYHDRNAKPRWPIGALCFVRPAAAKELSAHEVNWDGWVLPKGGEQLAPAAFHDLPRYSTSWGEGGPLRDKYRVELEQMMSGSVGAKCTSDGESQIVLGLPRMAGSDALTAICRAVVAARLGAEVQVPAELVEPCAKS